MTSEILDWDQVAAFPGVFAEGSEADIALISKRGRERAEKVTSDAIYLMFGGLPFSRSSDMAESGIIEQESFPLDQTPIPASHLENGTICDWLDASSLLELDYRLRFCRAVLSMHNLPWFGRIEEKGVEGDHDALD